ncbi:kelch domain-containing protein 7A [Perognathus longimembris pacificus]|uniref:kelch domain-containing protein 7A n=1 Tax=Perognathus longimembris pacificus TaxID=214514 RepID=UPI002019FBCB|nr:kelch domain-containing protein 7A [Perognathus longimembris pacificus]
MGFLCDIHLQMELDLSVEPNPVPDALRGHGFLLHPEFLLLSLQMGPQGSLDTARGHQESLMDKPTHPKRNPNHLGQRPALVPTPSPACSPPEPGARAQDSHLDMPLTSRVLLSAAALLLLTAAYRLYKSRPAPAPPGGGSAQAKAKEEVEGSGQPALREPSPPGPPRRRLRCRRASKEAGAALDCSSEDRGHPHVLAVGATSRGLCPERRSEEEEEDGQHPSSEQVPPSCCTKEPGTAAGGKPSLLHHPYLGSEPTKSAADRTVTGGGEPVPWLHGECREPPEAAELGPPSRWMAPTAECGDMDQAWVFTRVTGASRTEPGTLQADSDMALAVHHPEGATDASYTFSSTARVRVQDSLILEAEGKGPPLRGKIYDYYVQSTSQAVSRPAPSTAAPPGAPAPGPAPGPLGTEAQAAPREDAPGASASSSVRGFGRKVSLLQIADNPELQLQPDSFGIPTGAPQDPSPPASPAGSDGDSPVRLVAGTNFVHVPLGAASAPQVRLDLGNCSEVLALAKRQNSEALKEAAFKVMSDNYLHVLRSPHIYGQLSGAERELILQRRLRGRRCLVVADVCPQEDSGRLFSYDDAADAWHPLARLPPEAVSRGCAVCSLFNYLFVVSGCRGPAPSNRVFCYNPLTGIWSEAGPLNQARPRCRLVALDGHLYAIGGECLSTVERYDPRLDRWTFAPPLPSDTFALAHTGTACGREIFLTGGSLRYLLLRFSAREQRWRAGPAGGGRDRTAEMAAVDGFLYRFDFHRGLGISVYRCSASTRLWYECASYRTPDPAAFRCAVVGERIYCVGRRGVLCFLADHVAPRFVPRELQAFPDPQGILLPTVLTLPAPHAPQTAV